jgi:hypothetical protein
MSRYLNTLVSDAQICIMIGISICITICLICAGGRKDYRLDDLKKNFQSTDGTVFLSILSASAVLFGSYMIITFRYYRPRVVENMSLYNLSGPITTACLLTLQDTLVNIIFETINKCHVYNTCPETYVLIFAFIL